MKEFRSTEAGFTLIEMLIATLLLLFVMGVLTTVTAHWLPNWNRGFWRVQQTEQFALIFERIAADLAAAEFVPPNGGTATPLFYGTELSVTFIRTAIGPNSAKGLEIVRIAEIADKNGPILMRAATPFVPLDDNAVATLSFPDPVVLIRPPYRAVFSYAGIDRTWQNTWRDADLLPSAIRVIIRNMVTGQRLAISSVIKLHINAPAECVAPSVNCGLSAVPIPAGSQIGSTKSN